MTKPDLIRQVAQNNGLTVAEATKIVESVLSNITDSLKTGVDVSIHGFGVFKAVHKPARTGRNPSTGASISLPAKNVVKFTPAKALKDTLNV